MSTSNSPPDGEARTGQPLANKSMAVTLLLSLFLSPLAYYYVGRKKLAVINLLTINYLLLGIVVVPIHTYKIMNDAKATQPE